MSLTRDNESTRHFAFVHIGMIKRCYDKMHPIGADGVIEKQKNANCVAGTGPAQQTQRRELKLRRPIRVTSGSPKSLRVDRNGST